MITFTFGDNLRNGLGALLTEKGIEKMLEVAIKEYNYELEEKGVAPSAFYCSLVDDDKEFYKDNTAYYDAKFVYEVMPYSCTFYIKAEELVFDKVEFDKPYNLKEFFSKDLSDVEGASVIVMFKPNNDEDFFYHPDFLVGYVKKDTTNDEYLVRVVGFYDYNLYGDEEYDDCRLIIPSRKKWMYKE